MSQSPVLVASGVEQSILIVLLVLGLVVAFGGIALYRSYVWLLGFIFGLGVGFYVALAVVFGIIAGAAESGASGGLGAAIFLLGLGGVIMLICGLIGAGLALALEPLLVAIGGGVATGSFASVLFDIGIDSPPALLLGIVGGIITLVVYRIGIILATAALGAAMVSGVSSYLATANDPFVSGSRVDPFGGLFLVVFLLGIVVQGSVLLFLRSSSLADEADPNDEMSLSGLQTFSGSMEALSQNLTNQHVLLGLLGLAVLLPWRIDLFLRGDGLSLLFTFGYLVPETGQFYHLPEVVALRVTNDALSIFHIIWVLCSLAAILSCGYVAVHQFTGTNTEELRIESAGTLLALAGGCFLLYTGFSVVMSIIRPVTSVGLTWFPIPIGALVAVAVGWMLSQGANDF